MVRKSRRSSKALTPIDRHVAGQLRGIRLFRNMSQAEVARIVGLSHQVLKSYEDGSVRISVGRLKQLADALKVTPNDFYSGLPMESDGLKPFRLESADLELLRVLSRLQNAELKRCLLQLIDLLLLPQG